MSWLLESWHRLLPEPLAAILLALVAVFCGAWVGIERERKEKPAGLRTMALVSLGSSVFTMVGYVFTSNSGDSGRVAAQIVAGIGFLGGGILLKGPGGVEGTTTAATIWTVAAMGMSIGAGYVSAGTGRRGLDIEFQLSARSAHDFLSALVAIPEVVAIERTRRDEASGKTGR
jgi:putative Mg2+ transporter-C (MgtC) family protein